MHYTALCIGSCLFVSYFTVILLFLLYIAHNDSALRSRLQKFLCNDKHTTSFLRPTAGGVISRSTGSVKRGAASRVFSREALVLVQLGQTFWSEECLGLTDHELVFVKPGTIPGRSRRMSLPLGVLTEMRTVPPHECPFHVPGLHGLLFCTHSRQYVVLLRGSDETCEAWIQAIRDNKALLESDSPVTNHALGGPLSTESPSTSPVSRFLKHAPFSLRLKPGDRPGFPRRTSAASEVEAASPTPSLAAENPFGEEAQAPVVMMAPEHMDLLVRPKGWRLGYRVILNNKAFLAVSSCC